MIGDSENDVLTGRNAGLWTCGVSYGFAPHTLFEATPDVLVDTPLELAAVLNSLPRESQAVAHAVVTYRGQPHTVENGKQLTQD